MRALGFEVHKAETMKLLKDYDRNGDGKMNYQDFFTISMSYWWSASDWHLWPSYQTNSCKFPSNTCKLYLYVMLQCQRELCKEIQQKKC